MLKIWIRFREWLHLRFAIRDIHWKRIRQLEERAFLRRKKRLERELERAIERMVRIRHHLHRHIGTWND